MHHHPIPTRIHSNLDRQGLGGRGTWRNQHRQGGFDEAITPPEAKREIRRKREIGACDDLSGVVHGMNKRAEVAPDIASMPGQSNWHAFAWLDVSIRYP